MMWVAWRSLPLVSLFLIPALLEFFQTPFQVFLRCADGAAEVLSRQRPITVTQHVEINRAALKRLEREQALPECLGNLRANRGRLGRFRRLIGNQLDRGAPPPLFIRSAR